MTDSLMLAHLSLDTGDTAYVPWSRSAAEIDPFVPIVFAETGEVPGEPGLYVHLMFPAARDSGLRLAGAAYFQIAREPGRSERPMVQAMACWHASQDAGAWERAVATYELIRPTMASIGAASRPPPPIRPPVPWLVTWLTPFIFGSEGEPRTDSVIASLAQIEQRIAVALGRETHVGSRR